MVMVMVLMMMMMVVVMMTTTTTMMMMMMMMMMMVMILTSMAPIIRLPGDRHGSAALREGGHLRLQLPGEILFPQSACLLEGHQ